MPLTRASAIMVRSLHPVTLSPSPYINILYGDNDNDKISALETIHPLGLARSFRSTRLQPVIQYEEVACTVFGQMMLANGTTNNLGISCECQDEPIVRVDGQNTQNVAQLAKTLPL